jgi:hypothetical protein
MLEQEAFSVQSLRGFRTSSLVQETGKAFYLVSLVQMTGIVVLLL